MLTAVERVLIMKGADLLRGVGPRHLLGLANVAREIPMYRGDTIYLETDAADALYMVVDGRVRLLTEDRVTSEVGPGEAFGTWSLVDDSARGHRAECIEDGAALALAREDFYEVAAADLTILKELVRVLAKRLRELAAAAPQEEARVEGEGIDKTEATTEAEATRESAEAAREAAAGTGAAAAPSASSAGSAAGSQAPATPGAALAAAAAGKADPETDVAAPLVPAVPAEMGPGLDPVVGPEPIAPATPDAGGISAQPPPPPAGPARSRS
ncbi:MAG TPA: Crp/Fnr family transcriptional regulator [Candidatus Limnocylindrales bacterium]|nr:Crp/Fnr family transcriptional regulator [Candidatus Limnocylindrales bacterium]